MPLPAIAAVLFLFLFSDSCDYRGSFAPETKTPSSYNSKMVSVFHKMKRRGEERAERRLRRGQ